MFPVSLLDQTLHHALELRYLGHGSHALKLPRLICDNFLYLPLPAEGLRSCLLYTSDAADDTPCVDL
eukprot:205310-Pyramimonas_sp.AAC.1